MIISTLAATALASVLVYGDSLSSPVCGWPHQLEEFSQIKVQLNAMPGRTWSEWTLPDDMYPTDELSAVIIWLGTNDSAWGVDRRPQFMRRVTSHVNELVGRGFTVFVGLPPLYTPAFAPVRKKLQSLARPPYVLVHDVNWRNMPTLDGIHPTCDGHVRVAWEWLKVLTNTTFGY